MWINKTFTILPETATVSLHSQSDWAKAQGFMFGVDLDFSDHGVYVGDTLQPWKKKINDKRCFFNRCKSSGEKQQCG